TRRRPSQRPGGGYPDEGVSLAPGRQSTAQLPSAGLVTFHAFVAGDVPSGTGASTTGPAWLGSDGRSTLPGPARLPMRKRFCAPVAVVTGTSAHCWRSAAGKGASSSAGVESAVMPGTNLTSWITPGGLMG